MTKIYIAGPMSGLVDFNFPAFHRMAATFRAKGFEVVNPAEINANCSADWFGCLRADIRELVTCDAIVMLSGWEKSKGAKLEKHIADQLGMEIYL
ncbi:MAG: DUF4406 domain-containing protein [Polaromonas sp.]|nr:DUF4406 domain-containing protein [Polaromonas sp.]